MKNRIWTLPLLLFVAGFLDRWSTFAIVPMLIVEDAEGAYSVNNAVFGPISLVIAVVLLAGVALIARRTCDRPVLVRGAGLMVVYNAMVLALEQIIQQMGVTAGMVAIYYLYLPQEMFTNIRSFLHRFLPGGTVVMWITAILFLFAPLLFILVGKPRPDGKEKRSEP